MPSSGSYQNAPQRIEEIGVTPEELSRRKSNRRILFISLGVVLLICMIALGKVVHRHQNEAIEADEDDYFYTLPGTGRTERPAASFKDLNVDTAANNLPTGCETTFLLMRHCEKLGPETRDEQGNEHCSYLGLQRSYFIPTLFGPDGWPVPDSLFALRVHRSDHLNFREVETLIPLAHAHGLDIQSNVTGNREMTRIAFQGLASGNWCGKVVVVSWKHELLGDLAKRMGCKDCPAEYPDGVFDTVWQLKYVYDVTGTDIVQQIQKEQISAFDTDGTRRLVDDNGDVTSGGQHRDLSKAFKTRKHKKKKKSKADTHVIDTKRQWTLYSSMVHQGFDPLKFSAQSGDYSGIMRTGGGWYKSAGGPDEL